MKNTGSGKKWIAVSLVALLAAGGVLYGYVQKSRQAETAGREMPAVAEAAAVNPGEVVVIVNGRNITRGEVNKAFEANFGAKLDQLSAEQVAGIHARVDPQIIDSLIVKMLLVEECDRQKITASDEDVNTVVRQIESSLPPESGFKDWLTKRGVTEEEFRVTVVEDIRMNTLLEQQVKDIPVPTETEMKAWYETNSTKFEIPESVKARHILIATGGDDDEAAKAEKRKKAETIRKQLKENSGDGFADAAAASSDCPSKEKGGSLGVFRRGQMVPAFEDAAFSQKVGEIGPVVETRFGYHIIQVQEHNDAGMVAFESVKGDIEKQMLQERKKEVVIAYIDKLKSDAAIHYSDEGDDNA